MSSVERREGAAIATGARQQQLVVVPRIGVCAHCQYLAPRARL
jgi:hypothetical protein